MEQATTRCAVHRERRLLPAAIILIALAGCGSDGGQSASGADQGNSGGANTGGATVDADTIRERIIGNTVTGTMSPDSPYAEYYAPDGSIHGAGYEADWTIDNDRLCFDYDEAPAADCYGVTIDGDAVEWHRQGEIQGKGTLAKGNPNNF